MAMTYFPWLIGLAVVAIIWWQALGARMAARAAAQRACAAAEVRFIDELAFKGISIGRDSHGQLRVIRRYGFEFYVHGDRRYGGHVLMYAQRVAQLQMEPFPI